MLKRSDILALPAVDIHDRESMPRSPAVYFVVAEDRILYVGGTKNLFVRWKYPHVHHKHELISNANARLSWLEVDTPVAAFELEEVLTRYLQPELNNSGSKLDKESRHSKHIKYLEQKKKRAERKERADRIFSMSKKELRQECDSFRKSISDPITLAKFDFYRSRWNDALSHLVYEMHFSKASLLRKIERTIPPQY